MIKIKIDINLLKYYYFDKNLSCNQISKIYKCSSSVILKIFKENNFKLRTMSESIKLRKDDISKNLKIYFSKLTSKEKEKYRTIRSGKNHPQYKSIGSTYIDSNGYIKIKFSSNKWKSEHVYIVEKYLKRKMKKGECIHHINNNKTDNRISNLYLFKKRGFHSSFTLLCKNNIINSNVLKSNLKLLKKAKTLSYRD